MKEKKTKKAAPKKEDKISRKEALAKTGKYAAVTAAAMLTLLSPRQAQAGSTPSSPPDW